MATCIWLGSAKKTAQVNTVTPTAVNSETYTITINSKSVTYTADASATVAEITAGLVAAFAASTEPEFKEITAADGTTVVTLTANTAGVAFTSSSSATGVATLVTATTTANNGPEDWSVAANWSGGAVPVDTDDVVIGPGSVSIKYGLDQSSIDLASLTVAAGYTGKIGLPDYNGTYREYRTKYLTLSTATVVNIGTGEGSGCQLIRLDLGSNASTVNVYRMAQTATPGLPALQLKGSHASNVLNAYQGSIGLAYSAGETAQFPTIRVGFINSPSSDVSLFGGAGLSTITTLTQVGGTVDLQTAVTTWNQEDGSATLRGSATLGTLNLNGGTMIYRSSGTITTANVSGSGFLDFTSDLRSRTVTNFTGSGKGKCYDTYKTVTWTNGAKLSRTGTQTGRDSDRFDLDLGEHLTLQASAF